jgi:hypothetical protein
MKITIEREFRKSDTTVKISCEHLEVKETFNLYRVSDFVTNTQSKSNYGIFCDKTVQLEYAGQTKDFEFQKPLNIKTDELAYIQDVIKERVQLVKQWVESFPMAESATFEV